MDKQTTPNNSDLVNEWLAKSDDYARREPTKAAASAFGLGFIFNLLPIGTLVGALTAVLFSMARPVLLFLGLMKACELYKAKKPSNF